MTPRGCEIKEKVTEEWDTLLCTPPNDDFSPDDKVCSSPHLSRLLGSQGEAHITFGFQSPSCFLLVAMPAWQGKELLPSQPYTAPTSVLRRNGFQQQKKQLPRSTSSAGLSLWEWNATHCGASIVWAIQWAFHFQSRSKLVKVSLHPLPCRAPAACITITIILFCHVRSKG